MNPEDKAKRRQALRDWTAKNRERSRELKRTWYLRNKDKHRKSTREACQRIRDKRKAMLLAFFGGRCRLCRFSGFPEALQAHHLSRADKNEKMRKHKTLGALTVAEFLEELPKCMLLCANCHACVEAGSICIETALNPGHGIQIAIR